MDKKGRSLLSVKPRHDSVLLELAFCFGILRTNSEKLGLE